MRNRVRASLRLRLAYKLQLSRKWLLREIGYRIDPEVETVLGYEVYNRVTGETFEMFTTVLNTALLIAKEVIQKGNNHKDITIGRCVCHQTPEDILEIYSVDDMKPKFTKEGRLIKEVR